MKFKDIAGQAVKNLLRHRGRTLLTVLGVIVGCCSVVIMISIGIGMRLSTQATLEQMGDLNVISVYSTGSEDGKKLDASAVNAIRSVSGIKAVIPKIRYYGESKLTAGTAERYEADYITIIGEDLEMLELEGYELAEGSWDSLKTGNVLIGEYVPYLFKDTKRPDGYNMIERYDYYDWETDSFTGLPEAYVDPKTDKFTLRLGSGDGSDDPKQTRTQLQIAGVLKSGTNGYEAAESVIMDLDALEKLLAENAKASGSKEQAAAEYSEIKVIVENISDVETVEREIKRLGFFTSSMESIRKPMEQDMQQKQMLLGCVGAVSLFVAALGIANTMIMAITERIREIGVMKALGCFLGDIRKMFLLEAGCIGLIGGTIGIVLSYIISWIMNMAGTGSLFGNEYDYLIDASSKNMSVIPWWLAIFAVAFSILVGVAAGLYPAEKAVKIPALDAIKHE